MSIKRNKIFIKCMKEAIFRIPYMGSKQKIVSKIGIRVYISEYTNHNNEWREVASIDKYSLFNNTSKKTLKQEKIFCNL